MKFFKAPFILINHLFKYPTPVTITYMWSFGALSGIFFSIQLITGILLATHYTAGEFAFENVEYIMRDVNSGWLLRYLHANSASFFFINIYIHIGRGLFFKSYLSPRNIVWNSGIVILILSILTAFIGYVLPWGQMSLWGATVITNLASVIPFIGSNLVIWIWGGYTVTKVTVVRFYDFHYLFSLILAVFIVIHISLLHSVGSSSKINTKRSKIEFFNLFAFKDFYSFLIVLIFFFLIIFYYPNMLGHSDNYIKANPLVTPTHIVPEWYFLPYYAILRSISNKTIGVIAMLLSILGISVLPFCKELVKNDKYIFGSNYNVFFYSFISIFICLGIIGSMPAEYPYTECGQYLSILYFLSLLFFYIWCKIKNQIILMLTYKRRI
jgi:ubiquinol-cytochrome c reductase cytochrome b subunit